MKEARNDYLEMLLHHLATFCLVVSMIASNNLPIGCVILYLHDIADIPVQYLKCTTQLNCFTALNDVGGALAMIICWFWTRIFGL
jgi:ceramide synthetase